MTLDHSTIHASDNLDTKIMAMTPLEHDIFDRVALGQTASEISSELKLDRAAVTNNLIELCARFGARNEAHLVYIVILLLGRAAPSN